jgi:hypothetical protein
LSPFSTCKDRRSTYRGLYLPATFRLQGLATLVAGCSLRSRAGFVSHRQRSWDSPFGATLHQVSGRFRTDAPTYRLTHRCSRSPKRWTGPAGCGSWVSTLTKGPVWTEAGFSSPATGRSLGFRPSRVLREGLDRDFARSPLTQLAERRPYGPRQALPQSLDQPSLRPSHTPRRTAAADAQPS